MPRLRKERLMRAFCSRRPAFVEDEYSVGVLDGAEAMQLNQLGLRPLLAAGRRAAANLPLGSFVSNGAGMAFARIRKRGFVRQRARAKLMSWRWPTRESVSRVSLTTVADAFGKGLDESAEPIPADGLLKRWRESIIWALRQDTLGPFDGAGE